MKNVDMLNVQVYLLFEILYIEVDSSLKQVSSSISAGLIPLYKFGLSVCVSV